MCPPETAPGTIIAGNPVGEFFSVMTGMWQALPNAVTSLILLVLGIFVFLGIMQMIRT
jgi:hypothetical protein